MSFDIEGRNGGTTRQPKFESGKKDDSSWEKKASENLSAFKGDEEWRSVKESFDFEDSKSGRAGSVDLKRQPTEKEINRYLHKMFGI
mmetsp:Transcript_40476/g.29831  ORF Transcript_40476/g.29831 Transcript_40476/m.29831 type:complete len:87 (+) Transcript_40476:392-652(+)